MNNCQESNGYDNVAKYVAEDIAETWKPMPATLGWAHVRHVGVTQGDGVGLEQIML